MIFWAILLLSVLGTTSAGFFDKTNWYKAMGWCRHAGSRVLIGDFNGDQRSDMLCHDHAGNKWVALANNEGHFTGTTWHKSGFRWCGHSGSRLFLGDFNGDGRTDMLCHDNAGNKWVALATADGTFTGTSWHKAMGWCSHRGHQLLVGDFNGDGRDDILCHDTQGRKWISLANRGGSFSKTTWHKNMGWCYHKGSDLRVADFNGDGRADLLCHDHLGNKWVALATCTGEFVDTSWHSTMHWCTGALAQLLIGYFNNDARADLLCHQTHTGYKWIALAKRRMNHLFTGTDWHRNMGWCGSTGTLLIGDFNCDGKDDLLCHEVSTGKKWIAYNHHQL